MRILIVEDEHKIANALQRGLRQETYAVDVSYDADDGLAMATTEPYDVIILDRMLPGSMDGIGLLQRLRRDGHHTPVLLLTAKDTTNDKVDGLNAGADDYLTKPFAFTELLARVRALLRRSSASASPELRHGDVVLDPVNFRVTRGGKEIELTQKEFALLEYLMRHAGKTVTKDAIIQHVWDYDADILPNTVEVYMGYLRAKLDKPFDGERLLKTRRGFGYTFGSPHVP